MRPTRAQTNHSCDWFKDEVRELGGALGFPLGVAYRHPFPGLGLGVRTSGEKARGVASTSSLRRLSGSQFAFSLATIAVFQPLLAT